MMNKNNKFIGVLALALSVSFATNAHADSALVEEAKVEPVEVVAGASAVENAASPAADNQADIDAKKAELNQAIDNKFKKPSQIQEFKIKVAQANTLAELQAVENEINSTEAITIASEKARIKALLEANKELLGSRYGTYNTQLSLASSWSVLADIENNINTSIKKAQEAIDNPQPEQPPEAQKTFAEQKQELKDQIDASPLSKAQKDALKKKVDGVKSELQIMTLMGIMQDFQNQVMVAGQQVESDKKEMLADIEASNLTDAQKETLKQKVEAVRDVDASKALKDEVAAEIAKGPSEQPAEDPLKEVREAAKTEINGLANLDDEAKKTFLDAVDKAQNQDDINKAVADAKAADTKAKEEKEQKELDDKKADLKAKLAQAKQEGRADDAKVAEITKRIDDAKSLDELATIEEEINNLKAEEKPVDLTERKQELLERLLNAANDGKASIQELMPLMSAIEEAQTPEELDAIEEQVKAIEAIDPAVAAKKYQLTQKLQNANIPAEKQDQARDLLGRIQAAKTLEELDELEKEVDALIGPQRITKYVVEDVEVDFEVEEIEDENLEQGKTEVDQEGEKGLDKVSYKVVVEGDNEISREETGRDHVKEPVKRIVRVGTKKKEDPTTGETEAEKLAKTKEEAKAAIDKLTHRDASEKESYSSRIDAANTTDEVEAIVAEARKDKVVTDTKTEPIPFGEQVVVDENLELGKEEVTEGEEGEKTITTTITYKDGADPITKETVEVAKQPKDKIIRKGIKPVEKSAEEKTTVSTTTAEVPFFTETILDDTLEFGKEVVEREGQVGEVTYITTVVTKNGKILSQETETKVTKEPVNKIVRKGIKLAEETKDPEVTTKTYTKVEEVAFETEVVEDKTLEKGKEVVDQEGVKGSKTVTYKDTLEDGKVVKTEKVSEEITKAPVKKIVRKGTKVLDQQTQPEVTTKFYTKVEEIAYEVEVIEDKNLEAGKEVIDQRGQKGSKIVSYKDTLEDGKVVKTEKTNELVTKNPVKEIVRKGVKAVEKPVVDQDYKQLFQNNMLSLSKLTADEKQGFKDRMDAAKTNGEIYNIYNEAVALNNSRKVKPAPAKEITTKSITRVEKIAFETEIIEDKTLEAGKEVLVQAGKDGSKILTIKQTLENGVVVKEEVTSELISLNPVNKVIRKGTKTATQVERPVVDELKAYKDLVKGLINKLSKLTAAEKALYNQSIDALNSRQAIQNIYNQAIGLNNNRLVVKPSNPVKPIKPVYPTPRPTDRPVVPSKPSPVTPDKTVVSSDIIYVGKGYKTVKEGFYSRDSLLDQRQELIKAIENNQIAVRAAKFLLEYTPNTVAGVRDRLLALIAKAENLNARAELVLADLNLILN